MTNRKICFDRKGLFMGIVGMIIIVYFLIFFYYKNTEDITITDLSKHIIISMRNIESNMLLKNKELNTEIPIQTENEIEQIKEEIKKQNSIELQNIAEEINKQNSIDFEEIKRQNAIELANKELINKQLQYQVQNAANQLKIANENLVKQQTMLIKTEPNPGGLMKEQNPMYKNIQQSIINLPKRDYVTMRDRAVLDDPLYPPLARVERPIFDELIDNMNVNISTRGSEDTFRQIGFLINTNKNVMDMGSNNWKLYGRQSYRGSTIGEFYVIPTNDFKADMKIYIKDNMMVGPEKMRDLYALPTRIKLNAPFFGKEEYEIVELPKADLNSRYF